MAHPSCRASCRGTSSLYWGVSDHKKASPDPIIFWKYQCALMKHNNFMKQIGSIIVILNHSENFFGGHFYIFVAFWSFFMSENLVFGLLSRKILVTHIFKNLTVQNHLYWKKKMIKKSTLFIYLIRKIIKHLVIK